MKHKCKETVGINLGGSPTIILMSGLQGSGKTTFSGKLANYLKNKKTKQVLLVGCDVYRPAAINQLRVVGDQIGVEVYAEEGNMNPVEISKNAIKHANAADPSKRVQVRINASDNEISIRVYDSGYGFDLNSVAKPSFESDVLEEKGRGIFIIRSLMDSVEYRRANGGNVLEMKKNLRQH